MAPQLLAGLLAVEGGARGAERAVMEGVAQRLHCRERPARLHALKAAAQRVIDPLYPPPRGLLHSCLGALNQHGAGGGHEGGGGGEGGGGFGWRVAGTAALAYGVALVLALAADLAATSTALAANGIAAATTLHALALAAIALFFCIG